jgi:hypothetical protein
VVKVRHQILLVTVVLVVVVDKLQTQQDQVTLLAQHHHKETTVELHRLLPLFLLAVEAGQEALVKPQMELVPQVMVGPRHLLLLLVHL